MDDLRSAISEYADDHLLNEYHHHQGQYTSEALDLMRQEIATRGLDGAKPGPSAGGRGETDEGKVLHFSAEDLVQFDHSFSRTDLLLATAMLQEKKIPFHIDNPESTDTLPIQSESEMRFTVRVHKDFVDESHALLDEHFVKADNKYILKYTGARDRLNAFNFHDIHLSEKEGAEELDVSFTADEKKVLTALAKRLLTEAEAIETAQDRVLFYYDAIGPLVERLNEPDRTALSRNDLLAILEILQVYVADPSLPASMDEAIAQLLAAFLGE
jgi:hypothetical protein